VPPFLLEDCRAGLMNTLRGGEVPARVVTATVTPAAKGPWRLFLDAAAHSLTGMGRWRQPVGAVAMLALGFVGARVTMSGPARTAPAPAGEDVFTTVRSVQPDATGHVKISYDETRRNSIRGRMDDPDIQRLMLAGAHEDDAAVRNEAMDLLKRAPAPPKCAMRCSTPWPRTAIPGCA